jgi:hypothetical protein
MIIQKKDIKKKMHKYVGVTYIVKKVNNDGTFVVNAYDEYDDGVQRLRIANAIVRFSYNISSPKLEIGKCFYNVEAMVVLDQKLQKRVYVVSSYTNTPIVAVI